MASKEDIHTAIFAIIVFGPSKVYSYNIRRVEGEEASITLTNFYYIANVSIRIHAHFLSFVITSESCLYQYP